MADKAAIINSAVHLTGHAESNDPLNDEAEWVARCRNRLREKTSLLFETHPWNFCSTVEQLSATEPDPDGWTYGFNKPSKCWRIVKVANCAGNMSPDRASSPYEDQAGRILSDDEDVFLKYIDGYWLERYGAWPQVFADAVSGAVAYAVGPVTRSEAITDELLRKKSERFLRAAKSWDAQQNPVWQPPPSKWQVARFYGMSRRRSENG
jgi:hypothetical protein